jgi:hypothetical protein
MTVGAIIFLHRGIADYLTLVLRQARLANPGKPIIFLGDDDSIPLARDYAQCFHLADYAVGAMRFLNAYIHMSRNAPQFTRGNIARWFVLRDFCRCQGIVSPFHVDSDVLLFAPVESLVARLARAFGHFDVALSGLSGPVSISGHAALWHDLGRLEEFCSMVEDIYTLADPTAFLELVAFYQLPTTSGVPDAGLVGDMTLLGAFRRRSTARIVDVGAIVEAATFDHNINLPEQDGRRFVMAAGIKQLIWCDGTPHGVLQEGGSLVRFDALHFQGAAKQYIPAFTTAVPDGSAEGAPPVALAPESLVRAAYQVFLDRDPDAEGLRFWTQQLAEGLRPLKLLNGLVDSAEFNARLVNDWESLHPRRDLVRALAATLQA